MERQQDKDASEIENELFQEIRTVRDISLSLSLLVCFPSSLLCAFALL